MSGFAAYLLIDLSTGAAERREIPEAVMRSRIGGAGLGVHLARELTPAGVDPFAPEAPIVFVFSPLVGTPLTTSGQVRRGRQIAPDRAPERCPLVEPLRDRRPHDRA